jgi:hypothetical protein
MRRGRALMLFGGRHFTVSFCLMIACTFRAFHNNVESGGGRQHAIRTQSIRHAEHAYNALANTERIVLDSRHAMRAGPRVASH